MRVGDDISMISNTKKINLYGSKKFYSGWCMCSRTDVDQCQQQTKIDRSRKRIPNTLTQSRFSPLFHHLHLEKLINCEETKQKNYTIGKIKKQFTLYRRGLYYDKTSTFLSPTTANLL